MGGPETNYQQFIEAAGSIRRIEPLEASIESQLCATAILRPAIQKYLFNQTVCEFAEEFEHRTTPDSRFETLKSIAFLSSLPIGHEIFVKTIFEARRPTTEGDQKRFDDRMAELLLPSLFAADNYPRQLSITRQFFRPDLPNEQRAHRAEVLFRAMLRYSENPWLFEKISDHPPLIQHRDRHILSLRNQLDQTNGDRDALRECLRLYAAVDPTTFDQKNKYQHALRTLMKKDALERFDVEPEAALAVLDKFSLSYLTPNLKKMNVDSRTAILSVINREVRRNPSHPILDHAISFLEKASQVDPEWAIFSLDMLRDALKHFGPFERFSDYIRRLTLLHANTNQEKPYSIHICDIFDSIWKYRLSDDSATRNAIAQTLLLSIGENRTIQTYLLSQIHPESAFADILTDQKSDALPPSALELLFATATDEMKATLLANGTSGTPRWVELMKKSLYPYEQIGHTVRGKELYNNMQYLLAQAAYRSLYVHHDSDTSGQIPFIQAIYGSGANPVWTDGIRTLTAEAVKALRTEHRNRMDLLQLTLADKITDYTSLADEKFFQSLLHVLHFQSPIGIQNSRLEKLQAQILNRVIKTKYIRKINELLMQYTPEQAQLTPASKKFLRRSFRSLDEHVRTRLWPLLFSPKDK